MQITIFNEAGTGIVASGSSNNGGATVQNLNAAVAVNREYQLQVDGGPRRGVICTSYNAATNTATFA